MPALTCRLADDPHRVVWLVHFDDVHIGTIGQRAGVPKEADQWGWQCGFYPIDHRGIREDGTARDMLDARDAFAAAWARIEPLVTYDDLQEHRRQRSAPILRAPSGGIETTTRA